MLSDVSARQCLSDECLHLLYPFAIKRDSISSVAYLWWSCVLHLGVCISVQQSLKECVSQIVCVRCCMAAERRGEQIVEVMDGD